MSDDLIKKITELHNEGNHRQIISIIEAIQTEKELGYELTCLLARAYSNLPKNDSIENLKKSMSLLLSVKEEGKKDPLWHYRLGYAYFYSDMEEKALIQFKKAVSLIPKTKEDIELWKSYNLGEFIRECEDIIRIKKIDNKFNDGRDADEKDIIDFILNVLLHHAFPVEDIITDNNIYIPEWDLVITPSLSQYNEGRVDISWNIISPEFDYGIVEVTFGAGKNLRDAVYMAVGSFASSLLETVINTVTKRSFIENYDTEFNGSFHLWNMHYGTPLITGEDIETNKQYDLYFWNLIEKKLKKYIGNQKFICLKIYGAKFGDNFVGELRIDDIFIPELSKIIENNIEGITNTSSFFTIKQYIILTQHEDTLLPYVYSDKEGYMVLKKNIRQFCDIIYQSEIDTDENGFYKILDELNEKIDDFTLCLEALIFIPEIFAANVYENIEFPETIVLSIDEDDSEEIYMTQFADYCRIYSAVWEIFDSYTDENKRDELYNKLINMSLSINSLTKEEISNIENLEITIPPFELDADERFEIR